MTLSAPKIDRRLHMRAWLGSAPAPGALPYAIQRLHATSNEDGALGRLMLAAYRDTIDYEGEDEEQARLVVNNMLQGQFGLLITDASGVITSAGQPAAAIIVSRYEGLPLVNTLMTGPAHGGQGLAAALLRWAMAQLKADGDEALDLFVTVGNDRAERIYRRLGFVAIGELRTTQVRGENPEPGPTPAEYALCATCGTEYPASAEWLTDCPICSDERQYVAETGQRWTTLAAIRPTHRNQFTALAPGVTRIRTEPKFAIGQEATLIETPSGNVLWDCVSLLDQETVAFIAGRGGLRAICISHPHFFTTMTEWSRTFSAPLVLHEANRPWSMFQEGAGSVGQASRWSWVTNDVQELFAGFTLIRCGGHFPGSSVLHWASGGGGQGALFTGDTIYVAADRRWATFMYSYPNLIPLGVGAVHGILDAVRPFAYDALYSGFHQAHIVGNADEKVQRSGARYLQKIGG
jgi:GNAT superfamily N-acetyltransferase